jgi:hypothetical protein
VTLHEHPSEAFDEGLELLRRVLVFHRLSLGAFGRLPVPKLNLTGLSVLSLAACTPITLAA